MFQNIIHEDQQKPRRETWFLLSQVEPITDKRMRQKLGQLLFALRHRCYLHTRTVRQKQVERPLHTVSRQHDKQQYVQLQHL